MPEIKFLEKLSRLGEVKQREMREGSVIRQSGMRFDLASYEVGSFGYAATIRMTAFLGLMRMETGILTPLGTDMPLMSYDLIRAMGKDTLLLEVYDTQLEPVPLDEMLAVKARYAVLPDKPKAPHWSDPLLMAPSVSKSGGRSAASYRTMTNEWIDAYVKIAAGAALCDREAKRAKVRSYTDGLFTRGGMAVDQFKKMLGAEKAERLLKTFVLSCDAP